MRWRDAGCSCLLGQLQVERRRRRWADVGPSVATYRPGFILELAVDFYLFKTPYEMEAMLDTTVCTLAAAPGCLSFGNYIRDFDFAQSRLEKRHTSSAWAGGQAEYVSFCTVHGRNFVTIFVTPDGLVHGCNFVTIL